MTRALSVRLASVCAAVALAACGGTTDTGSTTTTSSTPRTYTGTFGTGGQRGTISLTSGASPTGTLHVNGIAGDVALTGTFTAASSTFNMTGGGYTVTAQPVSTTAADAAPDGLAPSPTGPVFATTAAPTILTGSVSGGALALNATLTAVTAATTTGTPPTTTRYCGVGTGSDAAMIDLIINGTTAAANLVIMGGQGTMTGTATANSATVSISNPQKTNTLTATFTFDGTTATGVGTSTQYPAERTNVVLTTAGCIDATAPAAYTSYISVAYWNGNIFKNDLIPGPPATGAFDFGGSVPIVRFTGTFTAGTGTGNGSFQMTSPGYTLSATASDSGVVGQMVRASDGVVFGITGLGATSSNPVTRYCGTYAGRNPFGQNKTGAIAFVTRGAAAKMVLGQAAASRLLTATAGGSWIFGMIPGGYAYVAGTLSGTTFSGTYTDTDNYLGTFTANPC
ncbi:MAG: hypothetical protein K2R93_01970 [Gemmatimonadaceae bacterium]|nr:hypothetical protein [Gemmatimonadaceae bacterium]